MISPTQEWSFIELKFRIRLYNELLISTINCSAKTSHGLRGKTSLATVVVELDGAMLADVVEVAVQPSLHMLVGETTNPQHYE